MIMRIFWQNNNEKDRQNGKLIYHVLHVLPNHAI